MKNKILKFILLGLCALFIQNRALADFSFNDMELKFAQVSDIHLANQGDTTFKVLSHSKELLNAAILDINKLKNLDFVIFTGDMVDEPTKESYRDFLTSVSNLNYPSIFVFGNHDSYGKEDREGFLDKNTVLSILERSNPFQNYGKAYFAFSPNPEYRVIVLDTAENMEEYSNGVLSEQQAAFLDNELQNNTDKVILIFQHHPLIEPFRSADHKIINNDEYMAILKKYPKVPIAIFTGHYHATKIVTRGNLIHVACPSLVTYPNAFREVKVTNFNDRVIFNFIFHETTLKDVQSLSKSGVIASAVLQGLPSDRNVEIVVRKGYVPKNEFSKKEIKEKKIKEKLKRQEEKIQKKEEKAKEKARKKAEKKNKKANKTPKDEE